jgi:PEGA domain
MSKNRILSTQRILMSTLAVLLLPACASITRGSTQIWTAETEPAGATVTLSSGETCKTPCSLKKKRKRPFAVDLCLAGFERIETSVQSGIKGAGAAGMAGNVIFGGLIGVGVDAATGATKDLTPNPLKAILVPAQPGCTTPQQPEVPIGGVDASNKVRKK